MNSIRVSKKRLKHKRSRCKHWFLAFLITSSKSVEYSNKYSVAVGYQNQMIQRVMTLTIFIFF